jgi:hypothetical protein
VIKLWSNGSSSTGHAPLWKYWGVSVTNTIGPTMGIEALKYISYPAQVCSSCFFCLSFLKCAVRCGYNLFPQGLISTVVNIIDWVWNSPMLGLMICAEVL